MPSDRSALIRLASTFPVGSPVRKVILRKVAEEDAGGSGKPSGKFIEFMEEVGDQKVKNPDTGNEVKVKSLKGEKGQKLVQEQFQKWLKSKEKGGDKEKDDKPKGKDEGKDEGKKDEGKKDDKPWEGKPEGLAEAVASSAMDFLKEYGDGELDGLSAKSVTHLLKTAPKSALKDQASLDKYRNDGDFWKMGKEGEEWDDLLANVAYAISSITEYEDEDEGDRNRAAWKAFVEGKDTTDQLKKDHAQAKKDKADKKKKDEDAEKAEDDARAKRNFIDEKVKEEKRWRKKQRNRPKAWQDLPKEGEDYIREEAEKEWEEKEKERGKKASSDRTHLIRLASELPVGSPERKAVLAGLSKSEGFKTEMAIQQVVGKLVNDRTIKKYLRFSKDLPGRHGKVKKIRLDDGMRMLVITIAEQYPGISFFVRGNKGPLGRSGHKLETLVASRQGIPASGSISKVFSPIMKAVKEWVEDGKGDLLKAASKKYRPDTKAYVRSGGHECPFCGIDDVEAMHDRPLIRCGNCQAQWAEVTKVTGIEVAREPEPLEDLEEPPSKGSPMGKSMR